MPYLALNRTSLAFRTPMPGASTTGWFGQLFLSYGFLAYLAVILSLVAAFVLKEPGWVFICGQWGKIPPRQMPPALT